MNAVDPNEISRRQFIAANIEHQGFIKYSDIFKKYPVTRQQLQIDAKILRRNGVEVESALLGRSGVLFSPTAPFAATYNFRRNCQLHGKIRISIIAKFIALSSRGLSVDQLHDLMRTRIIGGSPQARKRLIEKLRALWEKRERQMFLDGGTTTSQIAERLLASPDPDGDALPSPRARTPLMERARVDFMQIWTNNRHIFYRLGHPRCEYRDIAMVGGRQLARTAVVCGETANRFVTELMPAMDLFFLGASTISTSENSLLIGNHDEAVLKGIVMRKSALNIVVADRSKFSPLVRGYELCSLEDPSPIDLIITDRTPNCVLDTPILCLRQD